jgi:predicted membrane protein (TIGR00267 family)
VPEGKFEFHHLMESIAFGMTDGVICFLGIIVGVARATSDARAVIIASIVGGVADALGNSIGFFVSQSTERAVQIAHAEETSDPNVHSKKEVYLSGVFSFLATVVVMLLLIWPFMFFAVWIATAASFIVGTILALGLGFVIGKLEKGNPYKSSAKYAAITIAGAIVCYGIGELLQIWLH